MKPRKAAAAHFTPETFKFLRELKRDNSREWFTANKGRYEAHVKAPMLRFIGDFEPFLHTVSDYFVADPRPVGGSMFRIFRDTRFSSDKSPYKTHLAAHFRHSATTKDVHAPGFYLHLEPGGSFAGAGVWRPDSPTLERIRNAIVERPREWATTVKKSPPIEGDVLKRPPRGYDPEHPLIEDLKRKDFVTTVAFKDAEVCAPGFLVAFAKACKTMSPLQAFLTKALGLGW